MFQFLLFWGISCSFSARDPTDEDRYNALDHSLQALPRRAALHYIPGNLPNLPPNLSRYLFSRSKPKQQ